MFYNPLTHHNGALTCFALISFLPPTYPIQKKDTASIMGAGSVPRKLFVIKRFIFDKNFQSQIEQICNQATSVAYMCNALDPLLTHKIAQSIHFHFSNSMIENAISSIYLFKTCALLQHAKSPYFIHLFGFSDTFLCFGRARCNGRTRC